MPFKNYSGTVDNNGNCEVDIQQDNASTEWDIFQVSLACPNPVTCPARASMFLNGFFLCATYHAGQDTAVGPPDVILQRGDVLSIQFITGTPGDLVQVSIWYTEYPAGTVTAGLTT